MRSTIALVSLLFLSPLATAGSLHPPTVLEVETYGMTPFGVNLAPSNSTAHTAILIGSPEGILVGPHPSTQLFGEQMDGGQDLGFCDLAAPQGAVVTAFGVEGNEVHEVPLLAWTQPNARNGSIHVLLFSVGQDFDEPSPDICAGLAVEQHSLAVLVRAAETPEFMRAMSNLKAVNGLDATVPTLASAHKSFTPVLQSAIDVTQWLLDLRTTIQAWSCCGFDAWQWIIEAEPSVRGFYTAVESTNDAASIARDHLAISPALEDLQARVQNLREWPFPEAANQVLVEAAAAIEPLEAADDSLKLLTNRTAALIGQVDLFWSWVPALHEAIDEHAPTGSKTYLHARVADIEHILRNATGLLTELPAEAARSISPVTPLLEEVRVLASMDSLPEPPLYDFSTVSVGGGGGVIVGEESPGPSLMLIVSSLAAALICGRLGRRA